MSERAVNTVGSGALRLRYTVRMENKGAKRERLGSPRVISGQSWICSRSAWKSMPSAE